MRPRVLAGFLLCLAPAAAQQQGPSAVSADGRWRIETSPGLVSIVDRRSGELVRTLSARSSDGRIASDVAAVRAAPSRRSFIVSFDRLPELWEISFDPDAEPIFDGLVHDYRLREGLARPGFLNPRRTRLPSPLREFGLSADQSYVVGREADDPQGRAVLALLQLDVRRRGAPFAVVGDPMPAAARVASCQGRERLLVPDRVGGDTLAIDLRSAALSALECPPEERPAVGPTPAGPGPTTAGPR